MLLQKKDNFTDRINFDKEFLFIDLIDRFVEKLSSKKDKLI